MTVHVSHYASGEKKKGETSQDSLSYAAGPDTLHYYAVATPPCVRLAERRVEDEREKRLPWVLRCS